MPPNRNDAFESSSIEVQLGMNYREIFQSLGSANRNGAQENNVTSCKSAISIEEVDDDDLNGEETTACIVEEEEDSHPHSQERPMSRSGGVSIMCMTPMGRFEADTDALVLEDVSPVSVNSPASEQGAPFSRLGVRGAKSRASQDQTGGWTGRIWSPQPRHVGLSEFFLAGVQGESPLGRVSRERDALFDPTSVKPDKLSKSLLSQNVWKPNDSIFAGVDSTNRHEQQRQQQQGEDSASKGRKESPRPIIPFLCEPGLSDNNVDRPHLQSSTIVTPVVNDTQFIHDTQIHDFGIVDFLKAQPYMPKGYEEYSQVHRVSTVSPLTLSPNPPSFHWSDDSDDDFLAHICTQGAQEDQRADQDEDDRATLTDLAWELASTTGRLTQCELDDEEGEGEEEFEDSIETNDFGSGLSSSEEDINATDTYSASISRIKEKEENILEEEEVHALK